MQIRNNQNLVRKYARIYYPGYIGLNENSFYHVQVEGELLGLVTIIKHHLSFNFIDLNSKIDVSESNGIRSYIVDVPKSSANSVAVIIEKDFQNLDVDLGELIDSYNYEDIAFVNGFAPKPRISKNSYYTELITTRITTNEEAKNDLIEEKKLLAHFISAYREVTNDINIKLPSSVNWNPFGLIQTQINDLTAEEQSKEHKDLLIQNVQLDRLSTNTIMLDTRDFRLAAKPKHAFKEVETSLKDLLNKGKSIDTSILTLNNAKEEIIFNDNYKFALLEAFIHCEAYVTEFLTKKKILKGLSKNKIDDIEVPFSYLLNIELPMNLDDYNSEWKDIIGNVNWVRKKRNHVVHLSEDVSKEEAQNAIKYISKLIEELKKNTANVA